MPDLYDVAAIGNAIVDVIAPASDAWVAENELTKGAMMLVDPARSALLYSRMQQAVEASGGSAANTIVGVAGFGAKAGFVGKVKNDTLGNTFAHDIRAAGVRFDTPPATDGTDTAMCLVMVTPDAHRTMCTHLGASVELGPDDVDEAVVRDSAVLYLEGYLWDPPGAKEAMRKAIRIAKDAGRAVALSLSDPF